MPSFGTVVRNAVSGIKANSPVILTGFAVAGVFSTVVLAVRATPEAAKRINDYESKDNGLWVKAPVVERVKLVWPLYVPALVTGASTIACIIGAQSINSRRQAALIGAFTVTEGAFQEYREQVTEAIGKSKEQKVRDDIIQNRVDEFPPGDNIVVIGSGNVLCLDMYTGRYFESTMEKIRKAQNDFNTGLINGDMYLDLNEFYHYLDLDDAIVGEQVGFSPEHQMDIEFGHALTGDGRPCLAISFRALPRQDFRNSFQ